MTTCLLLSNQDSQGTFSVASLLYFLSSFWMCLSASPPLPFVSPIFTIFLALLQMSFWWDLLYFDAAGWWRRGCIGYFRRLVGGELVRVARALGLDSGNLC